MDDMTFLNHFKRIKMNYLNEKNQTEKKKIKKQINHLTLN